MRLQMKYHEIMLVEVNWLEKYQLQIVFEKPTLDLEILLILKVLSTLFIKKTNLKMLFSMVMFIN